MKLDKATAEYIIKAQMCSDSGKGIQDDFCHPGWKDHADLYGYSHKDQLILWACRRICKLKGRSGFHFYIKESGSFLLVYFNFKINEYGCERRKQISFHVKNPSLDLYRFVTKENGHATYWDHGSSREACYDLVNYLWRVYHK